MKKSSLIRWILVFIIPLKLSAGHGQSVIFEPNERELNLPFKYNNGRFEVHPPSISHKNQLKIIAQCDIRITTKAGLEKISFTVRKSATTTDGIVTVNRNGLTDVKHYPLVLSKKFSKESLGQYSTAVEVAQVLGITEVDSIKIFLIDPDINKIKNLVFFYDEEGLLIDRSVFINNHWLRCDKE